MEAAAIILGVTKAVGTVIGGFEDSANLKEVKEANQLSAMYSRENAQNELRIATADADAQRRTGRRALSEQITGFSQSGFGLGGSAAMSIESSAAEAELDALQVEYKGTLRNRAGLIEAQNYDRKADAARRARKLVPIKTVLGAATNLLSGYAQGQAAA